MNTARIRKLPSKEEMENLKRHVAEAEGDLKETYTTYPIPGLVRGLDDQTRRMKKILKESDSADLTPYERSEKEKRRKELGEVISKRMVPSKYYYQPADKNGNMRSFNKAVEHIVTGTGEMTPETQGMIREWQYLSRELGLPSDTEELRPES